MKRETVTLVDPVDPMGAFRRLDVDGVVPPPVDRTDVADSGGDKRSIRRP
jgi:hypothetical protein